MLPRQMTCCSEVFFVAKQHVRLPSVGSGAIAEIFAAAK